MTDEIAPPTIVLVAHEVHDFGGMERVMAELIRRGQPDWRFTVVAQDLAPELRYLAEWERIRVPRRPFALRFLMFYIFAGLRLRHVRGQLRHTCGAIVPNRVDIATVHFCHAGFRRATGDLAPRGAPWLRRINTRMARRLAMLAERWSYRRSRVRRLGAVSGGVGQEVVAHYADVDIVITPNGVDLVRFAPNRRRRAAMRGRESVPAGQAVGLIVGGDWDRKGLVLAIEGLAVAVASGADALLWVVGPGDERRFAQVAAECGVGDRVRFFGSQLETEQFYAAADFFVLPTQYEAAPLVGYEAAAASLPAVVTRVSGLEDLVEDGVSGIFVERTPESIGAAISRLAGDARLRRRMGAAGRRRVEAFSWTRSYDAVRQLYGALLEPPAEAADSAPGAPNRVGAAAGAGQ